MANGNTYLLKVGSTGSEEELVGQMDGTMTDASVLVANTNKSTGGAITYIDGAFAQQITFAVTLTMLSDDGQAEMKGKMATGSDFSAKIETGIDGESWAGAWKATGRSDTAAMNGDSTMAITIMSNGAPTYTAPTTP